MEDPLTFSISLKKLEELTRHTDCKIYPGHTTAEQDLQAQKVIYEASLSLQKAIKVCNFKKAQSCPKVKT